MYNIQVFPSKTAHLGTFMLRVETTSTGGTEEASGRRGTPRFCSGASLGDLEAGDGGADGRGTAEWHLAGQPATS